MTNTPNEELADEQDVFDDAPDNIPVARGAVQDDLED